MTLPRTPLLRALLAGVALAALGACDGGGFDPDLRNFGNAFDTSDAARRATTERPSPDARGVITYPNYQVAIAQRGDTAAMVAARVGIPAGELASYNAVTPDTPLRAGEVMALPRRVEGDAMPSATGGAIDVTTIAGGAIDRAAAAGAGTAAPAAPAAAAEPVRHKVVRGETAYSIARAYQVPVRALAEWNGLGPDLSVREGQFLLIPVADAARPPVAEATPPPGQGSPTPEPPSAATPLPEDTATAAAPASPDLGTGRTAATAATRLAMPVEGKIIRPFDPGKNLGIDIATTAGAPVKAAEAGTVGAITKDTAGVPILVIRHDGGLLTVYANIDDITVVKGAKVTRGQTIAKARAGDPVFVHFEVRQGFDSVDPMPYLQ